MNNNIMNNNVNIQNQGQEVGKNYDINYDKANDVNYVTPNIVKGNDGVYRWMYYCGYMCFLVYIFGNIQ